MSKRLTVHLTNETKTVKTVKGADGKDTTKKILVNTLAYKISSMEEAHNILNSLKANGKTITKSYYSNIK